MPTYVMPIKIFIAKTRAFPETAGYYTREGQPLLRMTDPMDAGRSQVKELDDLLFCEAMSIQTADDAEQFTKAYPHLRFGYHSHPAFKVDELDTAERYYEAVVQAVKQFNDVRTFLEVRRKLREKGKNAADGDPPSRETLLEIYSRYFRLLNRNGSWQSVSDMEEYYFDSYNRVEAVSEQYEKQDPNVALSYQDLMDEFFESREDLRQKHYEAVQQRVDETVDNRMFSDIAEFVLKVTSRAIITFDPERSTVVYKCPDLLTAMYMMSFVSVFNADTYRQCSHPKCHTFFKVDTSHPQSMCDKHMAARRRKRENQRLRGNTDYSKMAKLSEFEE